MKSTIKKDRERKVIKEEYLDDNTLLEVTIEDKMVVIGIRYVESPIAGIKENILLTMTPEEYMKDKDQTFMINDERNAIAIFEQREEGYFLRDVYETEEHSYAPSDFVDIVFKKRFPQKQLTKELMSI